MDCLLNTVFTVCKILSSYKNVSKHSKIQLNNQIYPEMSIETHASQKMVSIFYTYYEVEKL